MRNSLSWIRSGLCHPRLLPITGHMVTPRTDSPSKHIPLSADAVIESERLELDAGRPRWSRGRRQPPAGASWHGQRRRIRGQPPQRCGYGLSCPLTLSGRGRRSGLENGIDCYGPGTRTGNPTSGRVRPSRETGQVTPWWARSGREHPPGPPQLRVGTEGLGPRSVTLAPDDAAHGPQRGLNRPQPGSADVALQYAVWSTVYH